MTDPRLIGGGVNPSAAVKTYTGVGVPISGTTTVMARLRTAGGQWSGLVEATFTTVTLAGDYNGSGAVDQDDYNVWRSNFGATVAAGSGADGNGNGVVDAADYHGVAGQFGCDTFAGCRGGRLRRWPSRSIAEDEPVASVAGAFESDAPLVQPLGVSCRRICLLRRRLGSRPRIFVAPLRRTGSGFDQLLLAAARPVAPRWTDPPNRRWNKPSTSSRRPRTPATIGFASLRPIWRDCPTREFS